MKICKIEGCNKKHHAKGYCSGHYREYYLKPMCKTIICSVEECNKNISPNFTKNKLCEMHGTRLRRYGDVNERKKERDIKNLIDALLNSESPLDFELINNNSFSDIGRLYYGDECMECGWNTGQCEAHHKTPKSKGGKSTLRNCLILCPNCHSLKHIRKKERFSEDIKQQLENKIKNFKP